MHVLQRGDWIENRGSCRLFLVVGEKTQSEALLKDLKKDLGGGGEVSEVRFLGRTIRATPAQTLRYFGT